MNNTLEFFFATDNNFVKHLSVAIASLLHNSAEDDIINIYILTNHLEDESIRNLYSLINIKMCNIEIIKINDEQFTNLDTPGYINSSTTFYRYLIPKIKPDIDKALYLDCDLVVKKSLHSLFNTDLKDNYFGGVEDVHCGIYQNKLKPGFNLNTKYINAGVLLINCKKLRADNVTEKMYELTQKLNSKLYSQADQDVINLISEGKKIILDLKYNVISAAFNKNLSTSYTKEQIENALKDPIIIHYTDRLKPWVNEGFPLNKFAYEYHKYLKITPYASDIDIFLKKMRFENKQFLRKKERLLNNTLIKLFIDIIRLLPNLFSFLKCFLCFDKQRSEFNKKIRLADSTHPRQLR
jgi:lipopolysaccharide biosynthesis glycosyltransferase